MLGLSLMLSLCLVGLGWLGWGRHHQSQMQSPLQQHHDKAMPLSIVAGKGNSHICAILKLERKLGLDTCK